MSRLMSDMRANLVHKLTVRIEEEQNRLGRGGAGSFDEYRRAVGKIAAFEEAVTIVNELFRKVDDDDE